MINKKEILIKIDSIKKKNENSSAIPMVWEVDYFESPFIFEGDGGKGIKSLTLIFTHDISYFLIGTRVILMDEHYPDKILLDFLEIVETSDFRPGKILVKKKDLFELLEEVIGDLDLELELVKRLPAAEWVKRGFNKLQRQ